jgi:hypothetical protein
MLFIIQTFKNSSYYVFVVIFELELISNPEHGTPLVSNDKEVPSFLCRLYKVWNPLPK